eukprot:GHVN01100437.1.p1 GENE.GHVN01100437.1~~GHVN01100437.1.p1  ORF type:complete len:226 (+),score=10.68 GHVN01100437.1:230-907(+)
MYGPEVIHVRSHPEPLIPLIPLSVSRALPESPILPFSSLGFSGHTSSKLGPVVGEHPHIDLVHNGGVIHPFQLPLGAPYEFDSPKDRLMITMASPLPTELIRMPPEELAIRIKDVNRAHLLHCIGVMALLAFVSLVIRPTSLALGIVGALIVFGREFSSRFLHNVLQGTCRRINRRLSPVSVAFSVIRDVHPDPLFCGVLNKGKFILRITDLKGIAVESRGTVML